MIKNVLKTYNELNNFLINNHDNTISEDSYKYIVYNNINHDDRLYNDIFNELYNSKVKNFPFTNTEFNIRRKTNLYDLLIIFANLTKSKEIESGFLVDGFNSFIIPSEENIEFNTANNIKSLRHFEHFDTISYWDICDISYRRLYNISPNIDPEYSECCIFPFNELLKNIIPDDPYLLFKVFIIDPRILFSIIRNSEIEAYRTIEVTFINNHVPSIFIHKLGFNQLMYYFNLIFKRKCKYLNELYEKYYIQYFIYQEKVFNYIFNTAVYDNYTLQTIRSQIYSTVLDGDHKSYINLYVDEDSLKVLDDDPNESRRINTYKKLYYYIYQLRLNRPELLNRNKKFIFSKPFYLNEDIFALYNKYENLFYITKEDLSLNPMIPKMAIEYMKNLYNINITLDPNEVNESIITGKAEERDLEVLFKGMNL